MSDWIIVVLSDDCPLRGFLDDTCMPMSMGGTKNVPCSRNICPHLASKDNWVYPRDPEKGWQEGEVPDSPRPWLVTVGYQQGGYPDFIASGIFTGKEWQTMGGSLWEKNGAVVIAYQPLPEAAKREGRG